MLYTSPGDQLPDIWVLPPRQLQTSSLQKVRQYKAEKPTNSSATTSVLHSISSMKQQGINYVTSLLFWVHVAVFARFLQTNKGTSVHTIHLHMLSFGKVELDIMYFHRYTHFTLFISITTISLFPLSQYQQVGTKKPYIFGQEVLRGQPFFILPETLSQ